MADDREAVRLRYDQAQELVAIAIAAEASALRRGTHFGLSSDRIAALCGVSRPEGRRIADRLRLMLHRRSRAEDMREVGEGCDSSSFTCGDRKDERDGWTMGCQSSQGELGYWCAELCWHAITARL